MNDLEIDLPIPGGSKERMLLWLIFYVPALERIRDEQGGEAREIARQALAESGMTELERELLRRHERFWLEPDDPAA